MTTKVANNESIIEREDSSNEKPIIDVAWLRKSISGLATVISTHACIGDKWKIALNSGNWEDEFLHQMLAEAEVIGSHVALDRFKFFSEQLIKSHSQVKAACKSDTDFDIDKALSALAQVALDGSQLLAERAVARSKIESSKSLLGKMKAGKQQGPQGKRKEFARRLYAKNRHLTKSPRAAAQRLGEEIVRNASLFGAPLSADRATQTIYEWFLEYDKEHPR